MQGLQPGTTFDIKNTSREMNMIKEAEYHVYSIHCSVATTFEFVLIGTVKSAIHDYSGNKIGSRRQIPFTSSYALTVHGVQSMTPEAVAMDFWKVCPNGHPMVLFTPPCRDLKISKRLG